MGLREQTALQPVEALSGTLFSEMGEKAAERVVTRLLHEQRLQSLPLVGRKCYYMLTPEAARANSLQSDGLDRPMGFQSLLQNYAMMAYCLLCQPRHQRLTKVEFVARFPEYAIPKIMGTAHRTRYYIDTSDRAAGIARLALMVPDLGSHPRRLVRKMRRSIEIRREVNKPFAELIEKRLFSITILTAFSPKARQLERLMQKEPFHSRVVVIPGLNELLPIARKKHYGAGDQEPA